MGIGSNNEILIGMLITEVTFFPDESAEIFGFWYYRKKTLPESREEKQLLLTDCAMGRCRKLRETTAPYRCYLCLLLQGQSAQIDTPRSRSTLGQQLPQNILHFLANYPALPSF